MPNDISATVFRAGMSRLAGAVAIVATGSASGRAGWNGMTVTAMCSFCAEPPSLAVCLNRDTGTYTRLRCTGVFSVNVLASHQVELARTFAGQRGLVGADRFAAGAWVARSPAVPVLADALASFECRVLKAVEHGTHGLLIGGIETVRWSDDDAEPLVYHRQRFRGLGRDIESADDVAAGRAAAHGDPAVPDPAGEETNPTGGAPHDRSG
ncbi:flavin reductase family protein [Actinomadura litoris]|uniref:flavin reductase family protein n=1 Tax=Actinomadura litoris TaxID=2678616 RepID=UPI001FA81355|nr:flavin reductase family protein [Actinomadura litoris]